MSAGPTVNVQSLHAALDAARTQRGISWRQLAKEINVSASTISRMAQGLRPDVTAFAAMTTWLRMPAENFYVGADTYGEQEPDLVASLGPLLRARTDLTEKDVSYLEDVIGAAARRFRAERDDHDQEGAEEAGPAS
ncbi:helix-turn-helix domain-containing protein [Nocardioides sp.]|uniref:helix-turn-helix domain-containing protein n=1 Tax=Nocardioides sp. TaxID=35761 RepID=UPI0027291A70|nr:helix-turn-helix domain-containing protein [Nocardioides sp.]MDO9455251.1 helix-turn-helix domain-containing protein [Nocardioides sp.]